MSIKTFHNQKGYTLIELLLYVIILSTLLTATSLFFSTSAESRVKNQSITEVNQQGTLLLEHITQTIRNATSITSPTAGLSSETLTLAVPTGALSPTIFSNDGTGGTGGTQILGLDQDAGTSDIDDAGHINATSFTVAVSGTITTLKALVGSVETNPNNKAQMAVYRGATPAQLLASSPTTVLTPNTWNTFTIPQISVTAGDKLWISYNTNALTSNGNELRFRAGATGQSRWVVQTYNSWPASWVGNLTNVEFSVYALVDTAASIGAVQIKEGAAANVLLTNSKIQVSNLVFKNLTRSGTPGVVQVSFTLSRVNPSNRNEYTYQKTFTATAALR